MGLLGLTVGEDLGQHRGPRNRGFFSDLAVSSTRNIPDARAQQTAGKRLMCLCFVNKLVNPVTPFLTNLDLVIGSGCHPTPTPLSWNSWPSQSPMSLAGTTSVSSDSPRGRKGGAESARRASPCTCPSADSARPDSRRSGDGSQKAGGSGVPPACVGCLVPPLSSWAQSAPWGQSSEGPLSSGGPGSHPCCRPALSGSLGEGTRMSVV